MTGFVLYTIYTITVRIMQIQFQLKTRVTATFAFDFRENWKAESDGE